MGDYEFDSQWMSKGPLCFLESMLVISQIVCWLWLVC